MKVRTTITITLVALLTGSACSDGPQLMAPAENQASVSSTLSAPGTRYDEAARLLAHHLASSPSARLSLLSALRQSPWSEHKIDLHAWIASHTGANQPAGFADFAAAAAALPASDLYVVGKASRTRWTAQQQLLVVGVVDQDQLSMNAWSSPSARTMNAKQLEDQPVLVMHPAETRGERVRSVPSNGSTIQDPSESDIGVSRSPRQGISIGRPFASTLPSARHAAVRSTAATLANGFGTRGSLSDLDASRSAEDMSGAAVKSSEAVARSSRMMPTYDNNLHGTYFFTDSHSVDEIGGAEVRFEGFGYLDGEFVISGVERLEDSYFDEVFGVIPQEWVDWPGLYSASQNGLYFY